MSENDAVFVGGPIFDGSDLHRGCAAVFRDGRFVELSAADGLTPDAPVIQLDGDILSPGFVDLQVNGGGGVLFNDDPSLTTLVRIAEAHRGLGATAILPTLITDNQDKTRAAITATIEAVEAGVAGIAGLHLEGPHLSQRRKGAHDGDLIRPMEDGDLSQLLEAATALPALMVTFAPESVSLPQVETMASAGILVSLGHTNADFETCCAYVDAGARLATHLFNAMSQLGSREPGLVGAALTRGEVSAGLIADGIHVHPASISAAWAAKNGPGQIFLVSDAMAVAGTDLTEFRLGGRRIQREDGRLTLEDGTLAGADLDLTTAIRVLVEDCGVDLRDALAVATTVPAALIGLKAASGLAAGMQQCDCIRIRPDLSGATPLRIE